MRDVWMIGVLFFASLAPGQVPTITGIYRVCSLNTDFAPGATIFILGTFPPPVTSYAEYSITLDGVLVENFGIAEHFIEARIPLTTAAGMHNFTVAFQGQPSNSFSISVVSLAPDFLEFNVSVPNASAVPQFSPCYLVTRFPTSIRVTPASGVGPGAFLTVLVDGVGVIASPGVPATLTIGGQVVQTFIAQASGGQFVINFHIPDNVPIGMDALVVTVGGMSTPPTYLPVSPSSIPLIGSVLNGASFSSAGVVAPGSILSIFGAYFGSGDNSSAFPSTNVNGISALFGNTPAPIFSLSSGLGQINVLAPTELPSSGTVDLTVQDNAGSSAVSTLKLAPAAPGIFFNTDPLVHTRHNAVAVVANTAWIAMPLSMATSIGLPTGCAALGRAALCAQPAHPGDFLEVYLTGLGKATPFGDPNGTVLPTGSVAPVGGNLLYVTVTTPSVTIGGQVAQVLFSGLAPGYAGLYQVNVQIPSTIAPGDDVPIHISMAGVSDTATIAIAGP